MKTAIDTIREALDAAIPVSNIAYNLGQSHESRESNLKCVAKFDELRRAAIPALKSLEGPRLTVDEAKDVFHAWQTANHNGWSQDAINQDLTDRLTKSANP